MTALHARIRLAYFETAYKEWLGIDSYSTAEEYETYSNYVSGLVKALGSEAQKIWKLGTTAAYEDRKRAFAHGYEPEAFTQYGRELLTQPAAASNPRPPS